uniref:Uncharacterized protein orf352 n=1 Tax=Beta vulgaris subsp. maritima TaxID=350892 RepID=E8ZCB5_BETVM|nr:hypothetical protein [Beta vulgaris subsp. maritima]
MVCPPLDWVVQHPEGKEWLNISDLKGGYLNSISGLIHDRYRLLSSGNIKNFFIYFGKFEDSLSLKKAADLCEVMNKLQSQGFKINSEFLQLILKYEESFVHTGYLMPSFLTKRNINDVSELVRNLYIAAEQKLRHLTDYSSLIQTFVTNIQRARYEQTLIEMASAYDGYTFYLPAFLDFRGRIYRSGILHFHERDLARSLILIEDISIYEDSNPEFFDHYVRAFKTAAAYHYRSFTSDEAALCRISQLLHDLKGTDPLLSSEGTLIDFAKGAKHPFQFLANLRAIVEVDKVQKKSPFTLDQILSSPITQDASASAYQILSYFLLDDTLAKRTNLIPMDGDDRIQDVYNHIEI